MAQRNSRRKKQSTANTVQAQDAKQVPRKDVVGLGSLPVELLMDITSYLSIIEVPFKKNILSPLPEDHPELERFNFLRALSQTCSILHRYCTPLLWERIEVCTSPETQKSVWERDLAEELVRQLEVVTIRQPSFSWHVKIVNVMISRVSIKTVLRELARCLELFPNLHTVQILGDAGPDIHYKSAFRGKVYSNVRTVSIPAPAVAMLACFPEARNVTIRRTASFNASPYWHLIPYVEEIHGQFASSPPILPTLKVINVAHEPGHSTLPLHEGNVRQIALLPRLECIRIECDINEWITWCPMDGPVVRHCQNCHQAVSIFKASPKPGPGEHKCVIHVCKHTGTLNHIVVAGKCKDRQDCPHFRRSGW